ncbi:MAG: cytochrome c3 family protein [Desulfobacteraceae bacterium]
MTTIGGLVLAALTVFLCSSSAAAGWKIDGVRYSQSVHGENACVDCHTDIESLKRHPQPDNVRKTMQAFFSPEKCLACHDDVQVQIEDDAEHGGEEVLNVQRFLICIDCHDPHYEGAPDERDPADGLQVAEVAEVAEDNTACMDCHQTIGHEDPKRIAKHRAFCYACHAKGNNMPAAVPVMDPEQFSQSAHAAVDCMTCHPTADQYEHHLQTVGACVQCHKPHEESVAHEAHSAVACQACHLSRVIPTRDSGSNAVSWKRVNLSGAVSTLHNMAKPNGQGCARCHFAGNDIGAAAMILPSKSVLCMPCHTATLTAGDAITIVALVVFAFGLAGFASLWFSGTLGDTSGNGYIANVFYAFRRGLAAVFSNRWGGMISTLWHDVLLQRRLYRRSPKRWAIHALIFWPFVIRFAWGMSALFTTTWFKEWPLGWVLIDKNHPFTAFVFDLTGFFLVLGIVLALVRGSEADKSRKPGLPSQDRLALALLGAIALIGFILEGMRIAMTGAQGSAAFAFIGYGLGKLFMSMTSLNTVYGNVWYLHAILTGAFVAYLPFSRMMHIVMSPVVLIMNAAGQKHHP